MPDNYEFYQENHLNREVRNNFLRRIGYFFVGGGSLGSDLSSKSHFNDEFQKTVNELKGTHPEIAEALETVLRNPLKIRRDIPVIRYNVNQKIRKEQLEKLGKKANKFDREDWHNFNVAVSELTDEAMEVEYNKLYIPMENAVAVLDNPQAVRLVEDTMQKCGAIPDEFSVYMTALHSYLGCTNNIKKHSETVQQLRELGADYEHHPELKAYHDTLRENGLAKEYQEPLDQIFTEKLKLEKLQPLKAKKPSAGVKLVKEGLGYLQNAIGSFMHCFGDEWDSKDDPVDPELLSPAIKTFAKPEAKKALFELLADEDNKIDAEKFLGNLQKVSDYLKLDTTLYADYQKELKKAIADKKPKNEIKEEPKNEIKEEPKVEVKEEPKNEIKVEPKKDEDNKIEDDKIEIKEKPKDNEIKPLFSLKEANDDFEIEEEPKNENQKIIIKDDEKEDIKEEEKNKNLTIILEDEKNKLEEKKSEENKIEDSNIIPKNQEINLSLKDINADNQIIENQEIIIEKKDNTIALDKIEKKDNTIGLGEAKFDVNAAARAEIPPFPKPKTTEARIDNKLRTVPKARYAEDQELVNRLYQTHLVLRESKGKTTEMKQMRNAVTAAMSYLCRPEGAAYNAELRNDLLADVDRCAANYMNAKRGNHGDDWKPMFGYRRKSWDAVNEIQDYLGVNHGQEVENGKNNPNKSALRKYHTPQDPTDPYQWLDQFYNIGNKVPETPQDKLNFFQRTCYLAAGYLTAMEIRKQSRPGELEAYRANQNQRFKSLQDHLIHSGKFQDMLYDMCHQFGMDDYARGMEIKRLFTFHNGVKRVTAFDKQFTDRGRTSELSNGVAQFNQKLREGKVAGFEKLAIKDPNRIENYNSTKEINIMKK